MTEILKKEFSRKSFVKGGGAMIVGFGVVGAGFGAKAAKAAGDPYASMGPYDMTQVDSWLTIHADNTASLKIGKVEMGQGTPTALLMIAAEELNMSFSQMKPIFHDTNVTPQQGASVGSNGVQTGGKQTRAAAAAAKNALLDLAATKLGVAKASLTVKDGVVSGGGKTVTYGALVGDKLFNVKISGFTTAGSATTAPTANAGSPGTKPVSQYTLVGTSPPRVDIPDKVTGKMTYVHNVKIPGMIHGRVVRPRGQGGYGDGTAPKIVSIDENSIKHVKGASVVRFGDYFVGVVADQEYAAIQAAAQLKVKWADMPALPGVGNLWKGMRDHDSAGVAPARIALNRGNFDNAFKSASQTLSQSYKFHYTGHLPIGPSCCVAEVTKNGARIFSNSQDIYATRGLVQTVLQKVKPEWNLQNDRIRLTYVEGSSVYGSAPYNDANQAAAIMSAITEKPVRLQFMRWDEHGWDNYGPAQMTDIRAGIDAQRQHHRLRVHPLRHPVLDDAAGAAAGAGQRGRVRDATGRAETTISGAQYYDPEPEGRSGRACRCRTTTSR